MGCKFRNVLRSKLDTLFHTSLHRFFKIYFMISTSLVIILAGDLHVTVMVGPFAIDTYVVIFFFYAAWKIKSLGTSRAALIKIAEDVAKVG